jgi:pantoate--beta-alanine ligase
MSIRIIKTCKEYNEWINETEGTIGLVPTMGNLHRGHLSLLEASLKFNDRSVITIFVNPTQFGEDEDLSEYPRTLGDDLAQIFELNQSHNKEIAIFIPNEKEIYPNSKETTYSDKVLRGELEGSVRPTHFDGVTTVVRRLFEITHPNMAFFGKKDYQQLIIVKKMVQKLGLNVIVKGLPIVREDSGLAMSSRNNYLSEAQKEEALTLRHTLLEVETLLGRDPLDKIQEFIQKKRSEQNWNYLELRHPFTLAPIENLKSGAVILGNYQVGTTRLLDNIEWGTH